MILWLALAGIVVPAVLMALSSTTLRARIGTALGAGPAGDVSGGSADAAEGDEGRTSIEDFDYSIYGPLPTDTEGSSASSP